MSKITKDTIIVKNDNHVETMVDNALVLMHSDDGKFFKLDSTAQIIWNLLDVAMPISDVCAKLEADYKAPSEQILAETIAFAEQLQTRHLISVKS